MYNNNNIHTRTRLKKRGLSFDFIILLKMCMLVAEIYQEWMILWLFLFFFLMPWYNDNFLRQWRRAMLPSDGMWSATLLWNPIITVDNIVDCNELKRKIWGSFVKSMWALTDIFWIVIIKYLNFVWTKLNVGNIYFDSRAWHTSNDFTLTEVELQQSYTGEISIKGSPNYLKMK